MTRFTREVPSALLNPLHREGNPTLHRGGGNGNPTLYTHCKLHRESNSTPLCMELERAINIVGQKNAPPPLENPAHGSTCVWGRREGRVCIVEEFKERLRSFGEEAPPFVLFAKLKCKSSCVVSIFVFGWNVNEDDKAIFNGLQQ